MFLPPMLLYWCLLHPWVHVWRRLGPVLSMVLLWSVVALGTAGLFQVRGPLLATDFGTNRVLFAAGLVCLAVAAWLRRKLGRELRFQTMIGLPEVAPGNYPQRLVTEGLHAHVRHPRYLQLLLALLGWSLLANHPASYVACALWLPGVWFIVQLEERELRGRFGREFEAYCERVPRFIPRR